MSRMSILATITTIIGLLIASLAVAESVGRKCVAGSFWSIAQRACVVAATTAITPQQARHEPR